MTECILKQSGVQDCARAGLGKNGQISDLPEPEPKSGTTLLSSQSLHMQQTQ